jgi:hypothetical protein
MNKFIGMSIVFLVLSACVPAAGTSEGWVRSFLGSSLAARERACENGARKARSRETLTSFEYRHQLSQGELRFGSGFSSSFIVCYAAIVNGKELPSPIPQYDTSAVIESSVWKFDDISVQIQLEDVSKKPFALVLSKGKKDSGSNNYVFSFNNLTNTDLENIDRAEGFSFVVNIGKNQETVRVAKNDVRGF